VTDEARSSRELPLSLVMRSALALQLAFLLAVVAALGVTLTGTPVDVGFVAVVLVTPIIVLTVVCLVLGWHRRFGGFAGAAALGAVGVGLRLAISTQPGLEVGGGLPVGVTVLYVVLGSMVSVTSFLSAVQLRRPPRPG